VSKSNSKEIWQQRSGWRKKKESLLVSHDIRGMGKTGLREEKSWLFSSNLKKEQSMRSRGKGNCNEAQGSGGGAS